MTLAVDHLEAVSLEVLTARTALAARVERKHVATLAQAQALADGLAATHRVLDVGGLREFAYRTTYYDTPDLRCVRDHLQGRRRRFKCRRRHYLDTGACALELKLAGPRATTVKHARPSAPELDLLEDEWRFVREALAAAYGSAAPPAALAPTLAVDVRRVTLASAVAEERVTFDVAVRIGAWHLDEGLVIVETKSLTGRSAADAALRRLGVRPQRCSKYCVGMVLTGLPERAAAFRPLTRRFVMAPPVAATG